MNAEIIRQFPLFANLPDSEINRLGEALSEGYYPVGEVLFTEGSLTQYLYLVLDGEVEIVKALGTTDERVVALSKKDSILGEMSMFSRDGSHTASARAHSPLKLCKMTFDQFDAILHSYPELAYDMLRLYSRRLEESESLTIQDLREKNRRLTQAYQELQAAQAVIIEKEKLEHELQIAAEIQRGILPDKLPEYTGFDFGALMIPARQVGGDFYDFIPLDDHRIGIVVGDVCDKGIPAALFMALTYSSIRTEAFRQDSPGSTLRAVNQHLLQINRSTMFVTLLYGILDCKTSEFSYARAGHPEPLILDNHHQPVLVPMDAGQPVGLFDISAIDEQRISIPSGGTLLVYSDGLSETIEGTINSPTLSELCARILEGPAIHAQALCAQLWRTVGGSSDESLIQDDFTVVALINRRDL
jgi:phosphoserine phosphatase RsbU/P